MDTAAHIFFVTGLPRSRTAWMANLLTWGNTFCQHDLLAKARGDLNELHRLLTHTPFRDCGHSDPCNALIHEQLLERYPRAKWLILQRPLQHVQKSCEALQWNGERLEAWEEELRHLRMMTDAVTLDVEHLTASAVIGAAEELVPGWHCPAVRVKQLLEFNVQSEPVLRLRIGDCGSRIGEGAAR